MIVFVVAAAVRLLHLLCDSGSPFFAVRGLDANRYHEYGLGWVAGTWPAAQPFFWPPLYGYFLGLCYRLAGTDVWVVKGVQCGLGVMTCGAVYILAWRLFRDRTVALLAGLFCACHGVLVYYDAQLLSASLDVALTVGSALALVLAWQTGRLAAWSCAGLLLGLSAINRGGAHLTAAAVAAVLLAAAWRDFRRGGAYRLRLVSLVCLGLAFLVPVAPVAVHNATCEGHDMRKRAGGATPFLSANGGLNVYLGNDPAIQALNQVDHPQHFVFYWSTRNAPRKEGLRSMSDVNRYWLTRMAQAVTAAPGAWLRLMASKCVRIAQGAESPRNSLLYGHRRYSPVLAALLWKQGVAFPNGLLIPLGLLGLAGCRARWRMHAPVWLVLATAAAMMLATFVTDRYRLPLTACLAPYAAWAAVSLGRAVRRRHWRPLAPAAALLALLLAFCNWRVGAMEREPGAFEYANLAEALEKQGAPRAAEAAYRQALVIAPDHPTALGGLGQLRLKAGRRDEARVLLERAAQVAASPATLSDLANLYAESGEPALAEAQYRRATESDPSDPVPWANWGVLLVQTGRPADALPKLARAAAAAEPRQAAQFRVQLGSVLAGLGQYPEAADAFRAALRDCPENAVARQLLRQTEALIADRATQRSRPAVSAPDESLFRR